MESLSGKVAVITGAARRFGLALATALSDEEMRLALADNDCGANSSCSISLYASPGEVLHQAV
jgi:NAD(P)-dependent dehydrogenase (short-subunit alcohol dehydrogenase family)